MFTFYRLLIVTLTRKKELQYACFSANLQTSYLMMLNQGSNGLYAIYV